MGEVIELPPIGGYSKYTGLGWVDGAGTTVPSDGDKGWSFGAIFKHLDGSGQTDAIYINLGDNSSANFDVINLSYIPTVASREYPIPLNQLRIWDDFDSFLPETATADDLGFTEGTFGTSAPLMITSGDLAGTAAIRYGRIQVPVPANYVAGQAVSLSITGSTITSPEVDMGLDAEVYRTAAPSTDICATALVAADAHAAGTVTTFTITPTNIVVGDILDIRIAIDIDDTAGDSAEYRITKVSLNFTTLQ